MNAAPMNAAPTNPAPTNPDAPDVATGVPLEVHLTTIRRAARSLAEHLGVTGPGRPVPTCPEWTMRDLVLHAGEVHRWALHHVTNGSGAAVSIPPPAAPDDQDLGAWLVRGADQLVDALAKASDDLDALVFLKNAPAPRSFWARRQAHETLIHSIDGLSGRLGRIPTTREADVPPALAVDGLDELLTGFITRSRSQLRAQVPHRVVVAPTDARVAWTLTLSPEPPVAARSATPDDRSTLITGTAASLYLGLWNRGDEVAVTGEPELLGIWRDKVRVSWA